MPADLKPLACLFLNSVTVAIGLRPAFSAKVDGMTSNASAKALKQDTSRIRVKFGNYRVLPDTVSLNTGERLSVLGQLIGKLSLRGTAASNDKPRS